MRACFGEIKNRKTSKRKPYARCFVETNPLIVGAAMRDRAHGLLEAVGLGAKTHRLGTQLSGGEQQRVANARALVARPKVILADEPTGNLDIVTASEVQQLLLDINREYQSTLIIVTHNHELARSMDVVVEMLPGGALMSRQNGQATVG